MIPKNIFYILLLLFILDVGCSTPQHIRKDNYYPYDWGVTGATTGQLPDTIKHHPIFADNKESAEGPATYQRNANYFIFGLFPLNQEVKLSEACGSQPFRQAYVDYNLWQGAASILTLGIYTPRTIQVWCEHAQAKN